MYRLFELDGPATDNWLEEDADDDLLVRDWLAFCGWLSK